MTATPMTPFQALFTQARDVLLQQQARPAVYTGPDGVVWPCSVITDGYESAKTQGDNESVIEEHLNVELPIDPAVGGVPRIETAGTFEIDGRVWAIESIQPGAAVMHMASLVRKSRTTHAGRR